MSSGDLELLARYAKHGAEDAFTEVVRRHAGVVYTTALRMTNSSQLAEDVAQSVFLDLARSAGKLRPDTVLIAWLYAVTQRSAASVMRGETRRLIREQASYVMNAREESSPPPAELEPLLDDAMEALEETDRAAIMLRFFEDKSLADVGKTLGVSANAAQKRVSRAVEQMRGFFTHRGIATGTVAVTALLAANSAKAAPAGLVDSICATVHSAAIPLTTATLIKAATMTTLQKSLVGLTVVAAIGVAVRQTHEVTQLREQAAKSAETAKFTKSANTAKTASLPDSRPLNSQAPVAHKPMDWNNLSQRALEMQKYGGGSREMEDFNSRVSAMNKDQLMKAFEEIASLGLEPKARYALERHLIGPLIELDPALALTSFADRIREDPHNVGRRLVPAIKEWAKLDPSAASAWMDRQIAAGLFESKTLADSNASEMEFELAMVDGLIRADPAAANRRIAAMPEEQRRRALEQLTLSDLDEAGQMAYVDMVRGLVPKDESANAFAYLISQRIPHGDYAEVASFLDKINATPAEREVSAGRAVHSQFGELTDDRPLTRNDVDTMRAWLASQSPAAVDRITGKALGDAISKENFSFQDASKLVLEYQNHNAGDDMLAAFLGSPAARTNADLATSLAQGIKDPALREQILNNLK